MTLARESATRSGTEEPPRLGEPTVEEMLDRIGATTPSPGGGAVAALVTAVAAALAEMVAGYAVRGPETADDLAPLLRVSRSSRHRALRLADEDAAAYAAYTQRRFEHGQRPSDATRRARESALDRAAAVPAALVEVAADVVDAAEQLHRTGARGLRSDAVTAGMLAAAACRAASELVAGNLAGRPDDIRVIAARDRAERAQALVDSITRRDCARTTESSRTSGSTGQSEAP